MMCTFVTFCLLYVTGGYIRMKGTLSTFGSWREMSNHCGCRHNDEGCEILYVNSTVQFRIGGRQYHTGEFIHTSCNGYNLHDRKNSILSRWYELYFIIQCHIYVLKTKIDQTRKNIGSIIYCLLDANSFYICYIIGEWERTYVSNGDVGGGSRSAVGSVVDKVGEHWRCRRRKWVRAKGDVGGWRRPAWRMCAEGVSQ